MVLVAVAVTLPSSVLAGVALVVVLAATVVLLVGLSLAAASVSHSANAVDYDVDNALRLGTSSSTSVNRA
jgi:hypothetical protein